MASAMTPPIKNTSRPISSAASGPTKAPTMAINLTSPAAMPRARYSGRNKKKPAQAPAVHQTTGAQCAPCSSCRISASTKPVSTSTLGILRTARSVMPAWATRHIRTKSIALSMMILGQSGFPARPPPKSQPSSSRRQLGRNGGEFGQQRWPQQGERGADRRRHQRGDQAILDGRHPPLIRGERLYCCDKCFHDRLLKV